MGLPRQTTSKYLAYMASESDVISAQVKFDMSQSNRRPNTAPAPQGSYLKELEVGRPPFKSWTGPDVVFDIIDKDKSGHVSRDELYRFFRGRLDPDKVASLFATLDKDDSGSVSREEWIKGYHEAGFGQGAILGQDQRGLNLLLDLVSHHYTVDFADLHKHRAPRRIPRGEERGITLSQLRDIMRHIEARCDHEGWMGVHGRRLRVADVTMYDVTRYIIKPSTQEQRSSYIERIAQDVQPPVWFVCSWWGESFRNLLDCLEQHARDRGVPDHCAYFISAFANNQWRPDPAFYWSTFQKALRNCIGTVTVLDAAGVCLRRSWCLYETYLSLVKADHKWDLYTARTHVCVTTMRVTAGRIDGTKHRHCTAVGLLEGDYAAADFHACQVNKPTRENFFPLRLALRGLESRLLEAHTSVEADRKAILTAVAGENIFKAVAKVNQIDVAKKEARIPIATMKAYLRETSVVEEAKIDMIVAEVNTNKDGEIDLDEWNAGWLKIYRENGPLGVTQSAEEEAYLQVDRAIAGRVALATLRNSANLGPGPAYQSCIRAIEQSGTPHAFVLLSGCSPFDESMAKALARSLPTSLKKFTFIFRDVATESGRAFVSEFAARLGEGYQRKLRHLTLESNTIEADGARLLAQALATAPTNLRELQSVSFGMPCPFGHEAATTIAIVAYSQQFPKISLVGERIPLLSNISLPKLGLTSADLILLCASMASGSCGMVDSLDVSDNKIDNNGMRALELALKPGTKAYRSTINMNIIDLSNNPYATKSAKQAVMDQRKSTDDGSRTRSDPAAQSNKTNVVRTATSFQLATGYEFRIEPIVKKD